MTTRRHVLVSRTGAKALSRETGARPRDHGQSRRAELRPLTDRAGFAGSTAVVTAAVQACGSGAEAGVAAVSRKRVTTTSKRTSTV